MSSNNTGKYLRKLRVLSKLPLRTVAAKIDIDPSVLSKIERGERKIALEKVIMLARFFKVSEKEMTAIFLIDILLVEFGNEKAVSEIIDVVKQQLNQPKSEQ